MNEEREASSPKRERGKGRSPSPAMSEKSAVVLVAEEALNPVGT
jgi:hypothetical protein